MDTRAYPETVTLVWSQRPRFVIQNSRGNLTWAWSREEVPPECGGRCVGRACCRDHASLVSVPTSGDRADGLIGSAHPRVSRHDDVCHSLGVCVAWRPERILWFLEHPDWISRKGVRKKSLE